ncbi:hypothetical protein [Pimelobacter simplex]|uniref:hypothetical protein n=1 Tax=Nocardioides simplex TaxID=2045 RepID=UPI00214FF90A|nr:hypothetical protein [Pimelobacter simplex]UUW89457.1 hypothetical protein M0M43_27570 [Pimelobacter simplex]UUW93286.1 hypothetical protein M0M48_16225 [Pimelobacter simplex]
MGLFRTLRRLVPVVLATAALLLAGLVTGAAPAHAVIAAPSHAGELLVRGPASSAFTRAPLVSQVGKEGATLSFSVQVRNSGVDLAQYRVLVKDLTTAKAQTFDGTLNVTPLAASTGGFVTKALASKAGHTLTVKITIPTGDPAYRHNSVVLLYSTDGAILDYVYLDAEQAAPATGTTAADLVVKQGGQPTVGNGQEYQVLTAPTLAANGTATFTATLQNNTAAPAAVAFSMADAACGYTLAVKDGRTDITAAVLAGTYRTPTLAKAGKRNLTITVKATKTACVTTNWVLQSGVPDAAPTHFTNLLVNLGV